jgi:hypothetical protein
LGGVGSYVAMELAMCGVKNITLIDPDIVEESNRCRVLFRTDQVGEFKTDAVRDNIYRLRDDITVNSIPRKTDNLGIYITQIDPKAMLIDCRDNTEELPNYFQRPTIKAGYDGLEGTLHLNPDYSSIMGSGGDVYRKVPSYCVSAALMAQWVALYCTVPELRNRLKDERVCSFNMLDQFMKLFEAK